MCVAGLKLNLLQSIEVKQLTSLKMRKIVAIEIISYLLVTRFFNPI